MEHYQLLKYAHLIPAVLLLAGVIAHAFMLWKAHRAGDAAVITRKLRVTRLYSLPALGVLLVLQAMDSAGKGGIVRHVIGATDPQGVHLKAFKKPTHEEL